jgi:hypothetical protein
VTIAFPGMVLQADAGGRAEIALPNGHRITASDDAPQEARPAPGQMVRVELPFDRTTGWRFMRQA